MPGDAQSPDDPQADTHVNVLIAQGSAARSSGDLVRADAILRDAHERFPDHPEPANLLGAAAAEAGRLNEALAWFDRALALDPGNPGYLTNRGVALERLERYAEALAEYRRALASAPGFVDAACNAAVVLRRAGRAGEALADLERVAGLAPESARAHHRLGTCLSEVGQRERALEHYRRASELSPDDPAVLTDLGNGLMDAQRWDEASEIFRRVLALTPQAATAHNNLALALASLDRASEAREHYHRAIELDPGDGVTHYNYGLLLQEHGRPIPAERHYREAIRLRPDLYQARNNLGNTLKELGRHREALPVYREALRLRPRYPGAHSNMLCCMNYEPVCDPETVAREHRRFGELYGSGPGAFRFTPQRFTPGRRLRVGYVSADFRVHSVGYFAQALFAHHDRDAIEVFAYEDVRRPDAMTKWFRERSAGWRSLRGLSDADAAARIYDDGIDILVDLAGHTAGNRLLAFAPRPAPVQVTYLGYPNTTGLPAMDYRLCDATTDPAGDDGYVEELVRLPHGFLCYAPPPAAPAVAPAPVLSGAPPTFGSFNDLAKMNDEVVALWARLLHAVDGARLYLKTKALFDADARADLRRRFAAHGVDGERLELSGWVADLPSHLAEYARVDVALDTFPYCGTTTTCEALWMGVPVVTLAGARHAGRVGVSINERLALAEMVAPTAGEYVDTACALVADHERLRALRGGLRSRMRGSPLCDGAAFTRSLEAAYRDMWRSACRRYGPAGGAGDGQ